MSQLKGMNPATKSRRSARASLENRVKRHRRDILAVARRYGASNLRLFGSVARRQSGPKSDVDLLIDLKPGASLFDLCRFQAELEKLLGCGVDVATEDMLHWYIHDKVLAEAVAL